MKLIAFDIETLALPAEQLRPLLPPFNPEDVKLGNTKDPEKVAAIIEKARSQHEASFFEKAALNAATARVAIIGTDAGCEALEAEDDNAERLLLRNWWSSFHKVVLGSTDRLVGYYVKQFDVPFLIRRSWILGVQVPRVVWGWKQKGFTDSIVDLDEVWGCFRYGQRESIGGLNGLCRMLGVKGKNGDGKDFAALWAKDRKLAMDYCREDIRCVVDCAKRLGVGDIFQQEVTKRDY